MKSPRWRHVVGFKTPVILLTSSCISCRFPLMLLEFVSSSLIFWTFTFDGKSESSSKNEQYRTFITKIIIHEFAGKNYHKHNMICVLTMRKHCFVVTNQLSSESPAEWWQKTVAEVPLAAHQGDRGSLPLRSNSEERERMGRKERERDREKSQRNQTQDRTAVAYLYARLNASAPVVWTM